MPSARPEGNGLDCSLPPVFGSRHVLVFGDDLMTLDFGPLAQFNNLVISVLAVGGNPRVYSDFHLIVLVVQVRPLRVV